MTRKTARRVLLGLAIVVGGLLANGVYGYWFGSQFTIDPNQPYLIELGTGSGMAGLSTVRIRQDGSIRIYRMKHSTSRAWETGTLQATPEVMAEILLLIEAKGVMKLNRRYISDNIADGSQWIMRIQEGAHSKTSYFDNRFPAAITEFAKELYAILERAGLENIDWKSVSETEWRNQAKSLWDSIR